jgi:[ribosomal protein S5]-alanine N-acetyltransferase
VPQADGQRLLARGQRVGLRRIEAADLPACAPFQYTLSITEPLTDIARLRAAFAETGFWRQDDGAMAVEAAGRLVGTMQFYRAGPGIHGYEIGYILHAEADRGKGYASDALRLFGDLLFAERPACHRLQLIIETWNEPSARLAEACGYQREGVLRRAGYSSDLPEDCWIYARIR